MPPPNKRYTHKIINYLCRNLKKQVCGKMWNKCGKNSYNLFPNRPSIASRTVVMSHSDTLFSNLFLISVRQRLPILPSKLYDEFHVPHLDNSPLEFVYRFPGKPPEMGFRPLPVHSHPPRKKYKYNGDLVKHPVSPPSPATRDEPQKESFNS